MQDQLLSIKEASVWASEHLKKNITTSNISYLVQYGRIKKYGDNGATQVNLSELKSYYASYSGKREINFKDKLGEDLNWALSFDEYKEAETTKHVHRLHPYKGKFIPQLVEYFMDAHVDNFKKEVYFHRDDIVLDPFAGSGTTLVQANELGMHALGIDISQFNCLISNCKVKKYNIADVQIEITRITRSLKSFLLDHKTIEFETKLLEALSIFNNKYFPVPDYKYQLKRGEIDEKVYAYDKEKEFVPIFNELVSKYKIEKHLNNSGTFLDQWYTEHVRNEINFVFDRIKEISNRESKKIISLILSRTIRSCRATTHADLATLLKPVTETYYCAKHGKICKPLFSILKWWESYSKDTINRLNQFDRLRTNTFQFCLKGDSRNINIIEELSRHSSSFAELVKSKKINGIFSSPPYVGLIDYHEQHAYAYDLFGFTRNDHLEIGPMSKGQSKAAKLDYVTGISDVLKNSAKYLIPDYDVFLVANDKYNLYPLIAENAGMKIVNQFMRPVLNRTEKDKGAYSETIFHLKKMQ